MEVRLDGRSAIITGASKGLGLAMAKEFAASGADVAILARRPEVLEEAKQIVSATAKGGGSPPSCAMCRRPMTSRRHSTASSRRSARSTS